MYIKCRYESALMCWSGERRCVYLQYELGTDAARTAEAFLADWAAIVHLHTLLYDFTLRPAQGTI